MKRCLKCYIILAILCTVGLAGYRIYQMIPPDLPAPEPVAKVIYLDQGWNGDNRRLAHTTAQGTLVLPLAWMKAAEQGFFNSKSLIDPATLAGFRFLTDGVQQGPDNPDGLPLGWTVSQWTSPGTNFKAIEKVGFTCAACHTGQLNYKGTAIRIDGAGAFQDAGGFQTAVGQSILTTWISPWKYHRFVDAVVSETGEPKEAVEAEFYEATKKAASALWQQFIKNLYGNEGYGRLDALQRGSNTILADDAGDTANNWQADAPTKFPYLWDIWRFDWVQYNASIRQPMSRNVLEALGVRAETNFVDAKGNLNKVPDRWRTSVDIPHLRQLEDNLQTLQPPRWPAEILGALDPEQMVKGQALFQAHCAACHGIKVNRSVQPEEWVVTQVPFWKIGTDPNDVLNFISRQYSLKPLEIDREASGPDALMTLTDALISTAYDDLGYTPAQRAEANGFNRKNEIKADAVYKARPLVGIWASPPYLHNGSVPTLYDLLSPERPPVFYTGSREYDPEKIGFVTQYFDHARKFDTAKSGNSNLGHWFANDERAGRIGPGLSAEDRRSIIEYLKGATYANYPCRDAQTGEDLAWELCHKDAKPPEN